MTSNTISRSSLLSSTALLIYLALIKFSIHFFVNLGGGYGIFRDEFYYLACADHLDWGYVDQPPLSILLLAINRLILGDSLLAIRFLPALAGALVVFVTGLIIREMGGKRFAQVLGATAVIAVPTFLGTHNFFSMNSFDHLCWAALFFIILRILNSGNAKLWLGFGIIAGLGLQNKISILFLGFGLVIAMLLTKNRRHLINKYFLMGGLLAIVIFLPHIIWQILHGWPTLEFIKNAQEHKITEFTPLEFFMAQVDMLNPLLFPLWIAGLIYFLFGKPERRYRLFGLMYLIIFIAFVLQRSKPYYLMPIYIILLASGAILCERLAARRRLVWIKPVILAYVVLIGMMSAPFALPILSVENFIEYAASTGQGPASSERHEMGKLPQHFADMHGWGNMVATLARAYHSLSEDEKAKAAILVNNYGEAGAIDYYRSKYQLPRAICGHNSYWHWGPRGATGEIVIRLGGTKEYYLKVYKEVEQVGIVKCEYCMPYENNLAVFICRGLYKPLEELWPQVRHYN